MLILHYTDALPAVFVQAVLLKKTVSCTTAELTALNHRANEAITQV